MCANHHQPVAAAVRLGHDLLHYLPVTHFGLGLDVKTTQKIDVSFQQATFRCMDFYQFFGVGSELFARDAGGGADLGHDVQDGDGFGSIQ